MIQEGFLPSRLQPVTTRMRVCEWVHSIRTLAGTHTHTAENGALWMKSHHSGYWWKGRWRHDLVVSVLSSVFLLYLAPMLNRKEAPNWYADLHRVPWLAAVLPRMIPIPNHLPSSLWVLFAANTLCWVLDAITISSFEWSYNSLRVTFVGNTDQRS